MGRSFVSFWMRICTLIGMILQYATRARSSLGHLSKNEGHSAPEIASGPHMGKVVVRHGMRWPTFMCTPVDDAMRVVCFPVGCTPVQHNTSSEGGVAQRTVISVAPSVKGGTSIWWTMTLTAPQLKYRECVQDSQMMQCILLILLLSFNFFKESFGRVKAASHSHDYICVCLHLSPHLSLWHCLKKKKKYFVIVWLGREIGRY